jgi:thimet oligopeptidase
MVISKDLFSAFNKENLLDPVIAKKYRDVVLVPGGSLPAAQLVKNFLGRDFNFDGWKKWIEN